MNTIDRPFRFTWDFCVVWVLLVVPPLIVLVVSLVHPAWRERYLIIPRFLHTARVAEFGRRASLRC